MSEHTKGRLDFCVNPGAMAYELVELARPTFVVATVPKLANARRLLAAWNFSEGLATEVIEKQTARVALEMALEAGNNMERELTAARALLRDAVETFHEFPDQDHEVADRIESYLDACDTLGDGNG